MKPSYNVLRMYYPHRSRYPRGMLLELLGWDDLLNNDAYADTCAMRMSYALARAGVHLAGARMLGRGQSVKGVPIEPGQGKLSQILLRMWGAPEKYRSEAAARAGIGRRTGVVSFFRIHPNVNQGHIDLIEPGGNGFAECAMSCYFGSREVWFWSLK
jgi:hypothetical protein